MQQHSFNSPFLKQSKSCPIRSICLIVPYPSLEQSESCPIDARTAVIQQATSGVNAIDDSAVAVALIKIDSTSTHSTSCVTPVLKRVSKGM